MGWPNFSFGPVFLRNVGVYGSVIRVFRLRILRKQITQGNVTDI